MALLCERAHRARKTHFKGDQGREKDGHPEAVRPRRHQANEQCQHPDEDLTVPATKPTTDESTDQCVWKFLKVRPVNRHDY